MPSHPDLELLLRYHSGELAAGQRALIAAHLERCAECRKDAGSLEVALDPKGGGPPEEAGLAPVLSAIGRWRAGIAARGEAMPRERIAAELAPYLGDRGTEEVLHRVSESGDNLLDTVEPVLALFLGGRAAGQLVRHVVDRAIAGV